MSELKCPFCQQELVGEGSDNYWCKKCNLERHIPALYGSQKLWQELIRTRKALDVARNGLIDIFNYEGVPKYVAKHVRQVLDQSKKDK